MNNNIKILFQIFKQIIDNYNNNYLQFNTKYFKQRLDYSNKKMISTNNQKEKIKSFEIKKMN